MSIICHVYDKINIKHFIIYTNTYSTDNSKYVCHFIVNYRNSIYWKIRYADILFLEPTVSLY